MIIKFPSQTQTLVLNNIGMQIIVRMGGLFYPVTHASRFADTTDEILSKTDGFIAHMHTDNTRTVVATLIASPEPIEGLDDNKITDLKGAGNDYLPVYVRNSEGVFQIAKIVSEDPDNTDKYAADDLAVMQGNHFMSMNSDTSLICSNEVTEDKEVKQLHFIASNESTLIKVAS